MTETQVFLVLIGLLGLVCACLYVVYETQKELGRCREACGGVITATVVGPNTPVLNTNNQDEGSIRQVVRERDERALGDPLYPPVGRSDVGQTGRMMTEPRLRSVATRGDGDMFRLVGYLVEEEDKADTWKLFARELGGGGRAEFYAEAAGRDRGGVKVGLSGDLVKPRFRDIYDLPDSVYVNHAMFGGGVYKVVGLDMPNLGANGGYW